MNIIEAKLISCILSKGAGTALVKALKEEKGIISANLNHGRGSGSSSPVGGKKGVGQQIEKETVNVVVPKDQADEIFAYIHEKMNIGEPHNGFMYQTSLKMAIPFKIDSSVPDEK